MLFWWGPSEMFCVFQFCFISYLLQSKLPTQRCHPTAAEQCVHPYLTSRFLETRSSDGFRRRKEYRPHDPSILISSTLILIVYSTDVCMYRPFPCRACSMVSHIHPSSCVCRPFSTHAFQCFRVSLDPSACMKTEMRGVNLGTPQIHEIALIFKR